MVSATNKVKAQAEFVHVYEAIHDTDTNEAAFHGILLTSVKQLQEQDVTF